MGNVQVKKYKTEKEFQRDAERMYRNGWHIEGQSTRPQKWRWTTGMATNRGITTVTWLRTPAAQTPRRVAKTRPQRFDRQAAYEGWFNWAMTETGGDAAASKEIADEALMVADAGGDGAVAALEALHRRVKPSERPAGQPEAQAEDIPAKLRQLGELRDTGIVTNEEFEAKKAELLARL